MAKCAREFDISSGADALDAPTNKRIKLEAIKSENVEEELKNILRASIKLNAAEIKFWMWKILTDESYLDIKFVRRLDEKEIDGLHFAREIFPSEETPNLLISIEEYKRILCDLLEKIFKDIQVRIILYKQKNTKRITENECVRSYEKQQTKKFYDIAKKWLFSEEEITRKDEMFAEYLSVYA